jgi:hypothetical protein
VKHHHEVVLDNAHNMAVKVVEISDPIKDSVRRKVGSLIPKQRNPLTHIERFPTVHPRMPPTRNSPLKVSNHIRNSHMAIHRRVTHPDVTIISKVSVLGSLNDVTKAVATVMIDGRMIIHVKPLQYNMPRHPNNQRDWYSASVVQ